MRTHSTHAYIYIYIYNCVYIYSYIIPEMASERMRILIRMFELSMLRSLRYACLGRGVPQIGSEVPQIAARAIFERTRRIFCSSPPPFLAGPAWGALGSPEVPQTAARTILREYDGFFIPRPRSA